MTRNRSFIAFFLTLALSFGTINASVHAAETENRTFQESEIADQQENELQQFEYEGDNFRVVYSVTETWEEGYNAKIKLENTGNASIDNWCIQFGHLGEIINIWDAKIDNTDNYIYTIRNAGWNGNIPMDSSVEFGFTVKGHFEGFPQEYLLLGTNAEMIQNGYDVNYYVTSQWDEGFVGNIVITNLSDAIIEDWKLSFHFENQISDMWNAEIIAQEGSNYLISNAGWNGYIEPGTSITFGFSVCGGDTLKQIYDINLTKHIISEQDKITEEEKSITEYEELEDIGEAYFKDFDQDDICISRQEGIFYVKDQLLISGMLGTPQCVIEQIVKDIDSEIVGYIKLTNDYQIQFKANKTEEELKEMIAYLDSFSFISYVSLNTIIFNETDKITVDKEYIGEVWDENAPDGKNWGLEALKIPSAWDYCDGYQAVKVGLIDNMFDKDHEDLEFAMIFNNPSVVLEDHGTHVAGIMAAKHDNEGIAGVIEHAKLYAYAMDGEIKNMTSVMQYKHAFACLVGNHVRVINVSRNSGHVEAFAASHGNKLAQKYVKNNANILAEFLNKLIIAGYDFVIVSSAGNVQNIKFIEDENEYYGYRKCVSDGDLKGNVLTGDVSAYYNSFLNAIEMPSVKSRIIVVGAIGHHKSGTNSPYYYANFSNIGQRVDVCAPGVSILSCIPEEKDGTKYMEKGGTSMAAPYITGLVGLLYQVNPEINPSSIKNILCRNMGAEIIDSYNYTYCMPDASQCIQEVLNTQVFGHKDELSMSMLMGTVRDYYGQPVKGVQITACRTNADEGNLEEYYSVVETDENGNYEFVLNQGIYTLNIFAEEHLPCVMKNIEILPDETVYLEDIVILHIDPVMLQSLSGNATGKIVHALTGNYVSGASIKIRKGWNSTEGDFVTDVEGNEIVAFTNYNGMYKLYLPIGAYTLEVEKSGFVTTYCNIVSTSDSSGQNIVMTPVLSNEQFRIVMTWGIIPQDLDAHITYYQDDVKKIHVYYANKTGQLEGKTVAVLNLDDMSYYGPETVTITINADLLNGGVFRYSIHDVINCANFDSYDLSMSDAVVRIYQGNEMIRQFSAPKNVKGNVWHVFDLTESGIVSVNEFSNVILPSAIQ
ncbi:MAG: cellulose binding domain-containing protein [Lachnospiraceae bacterium]|nr:cellulose binding domain-containing protein [Lachnospiraceae bacterium]